MTGPYSSQIPLLIGIEVLIIVSFILSILALTAGNSINYHGQSAILTFNTSSLRGTSTNSGIADWYEMNYLSICSGMWKTDAVSGLKNQSTITCVHQPAGYTFSLAQTLAADGGMLPAGSSYGTIHTKAAIVLLIIAIALAGK